jgi:hypothetical protein
VYLGHIISVEGIAMDPVKVKVVEEWPQPRKARALCGFLGLTEYYQKFIVGYGGVTKPLTALLKCEAFSWSPKADVVSLAFKQVLVIAPLLQLLDLTRLHRRLQRV